MRPAASVLVACLLLSGCGAHALEKRRKGYEAFYQAEFSKSLEVLEQANRSKDRLLCALDRGVVLHTLGRPEESNAAFAAAEGILREVDVTDLSDVTTSFLINDYQLEYHGEDFEGVLVHPFKALNYLDLGKPEEALVECRAANELLVEIQEKYETKNVYSEDAFARYLSGIIFEAEGNRNDALVAYRLALSAFEKHGASYGTPLPQSLESSLLRLAEAQGLDDLEAEFRARWPDAVWTPYAARREMAEFVLVLENGPAPVKEEARFDVVVGDEIFSIAFPVYREIPPRAACAVLRVGDASARTELVGNVAAIAVKDLEDRYHRVVAKAVARLTVKHAEVAKLKKKHTILGYLLNFLNTVNERADLRSWETLPANFQVARITVSPGPYENVEMDLVSPRGDVLETVALGAWEVGPGETRFLHFRTLE